MKKETWDKLSAEDKLSFVKEYLRDEINRLENRTYQDIPDSTRTYCIRTLTAYQTVIWLIEGKLFEESEE
jgi:hypothetical protein